MGLSPPPAASVGPASSERRSRLMRLVALPLQLALSVDRAMSQSPPPNRVRHARITYMTAIDRQPRNDSRPSK